MSAKPLLVGLTGSIGMGKSTTAAMFAEAGVPVWDADAAVHRIYEPGGPGARALAELYPDAVGSDGGVNRAVLRARVKADPGTLPELEARIHPLVAADRNAFIRDTHAPILLFDIPLLFETGADTWLDVTITVSVDPETQKSRVLDRPGMDAAQFRRIVENQMPDKEKRERSDFVIDTSSMEAAEAQVRDILQALRGRIGDA